VNYDKLNQNIMHNILILSALVDQYIKDNINEQNIFILNIKKNLIEIIFNQMCMVYILLFISNTTFINKIIHLILVIIKHQYFWQPNIFCSYLFVPILYFANKNIIIIWSMFEIFFIFDYNKTIIDRYIKIIDNKKILRLIKLFNNMLLLIMLIICNSNFNNILVDFGKANEYDQFLKDIKNPIIPTNHIGLPNANISIKLLFMFHVIIGLLFVIQLIEIYKNLKLLTH
jgi:hypothetical protein